MSNIHIVTEKNVWEQFVHAHPEANFLQSWNWGAFHASLGKTVLRVMTEDGAAGAQVVVETAKRGTYATIAGGPLVRDTQTHLKLVIDHIAAWAREHGCQFVRVRPQLVETPETATLFAQLGFGPSPMHLTADLTLQLDLAQTPEEILAAMRKNTRYEIRQAEKLGIQVTQTQDPAEIKRFYDDQLYLAEKHGFVPFSYEFLSKQFEAFVADDQVVLFDAMHEGQRLASAFVIFYNGEAVYHYGTSTPANGKLPGSYACQWAAIQEAQRRSCRRYNMWGIAPEGATTHRFAGVSMFKRGFGGVEVQYLPAQDLPLSGSYQVTKAFELFRKKLRRL